MPSPIYDFDATYEDETDYLCRLDLFLPGEEALIEELHQ
jgi:hypothetical protein